MITWDRTHFYIDPDDGSVVTLEYDGEVLDQDDWQAVKLIHELDSTGTQISEGDYLKCGFAIYEMAYGEYDNNEMYEDNVCGNGWYCLWSGVNNPLKQTITDFVGVDLNRSEIIGNKYQHPNLLKGIK